MSVHFITLNILINFNFILFFPSSRVNVVAFDFLGHGESPHIPQSELYNSEQVGQHSFV